MKYLVLVALFSFSVNAHAKNGRSFNCSSGTGHGDLFSIQACVNSDGNALSPCKDQDKRHLGTAYLTLEKVDYRSSGHEIKAPVIEKVLIPGNLITVNIDEQAFEIRMNSQELGIIDIRMPTNPYAPNGKENGRYFDVSVKAIQQQLSSVICHFKK